MFSLFVSFSNLQPHLSMSSSSKAEWIQFHSTDSVVLTTAAADDDDVDHSDGLHDWKIIYVAPFSSEQYWNAVLQYSATKKHIVQWQAAELFVCGLADAVSTHRRVAYIVHYKSSPGPRICCLFCENEHLTSPHPAVSLMPPPSCL